MENAHYVCDNVLRLKTKIKSWNGTKKAFCHISYDAKCAFNKREELIRDAAILKAEAEKNFDKSSKYE
ncbi:MAG: hypothetical protein LBF68_04865 [Christensenellaceae bacterium]|jgi:hypothetical protein|nr:hypothetical protein [Christensenellaceae bacterium]